MKIPFLLLLNLFAFLTFAHADSAPPAALNIPRPDRAEVTSLEPGATEGPTAKLGATKARKVWKLLRAFHWNGPAGPCDKMQYIIRFYAKDKLIATGGICFHCGCFLALDPGRHTADDLASFDLQNANTKALDTYLANFFPAGK